jgi:hypothetical protein
VKRPVPSGYIPQPMKRRSLHRVQYAMAPTRTTLLLAVSLLATGLSVIHPAYGADFSAFGEDEDVCRHVATAAINGASGPTAAQRYDYAHWQCMAAHARMRQMGAYPYGPPPGAGNPHSFDYPDAFYSIPYATPGYGYDGFSR